MRNFITMHGPALTDELLTRFEHICNSFTRYLNFERSPVDKNEYRLDRMRALLDHCGNPERSQRFVHIAGSKGKGSTCILLQTMLSAQGYRIGQFTSPHITHYRERFYVSNIKQHSYAIALVDIALEVDALAKTFVRNANPPTMFELLTTMAFLLFHRLDCAISIIETGLGGRLDSTNVIHPLVSIITHLELEHTAVLGSSIEAIATEKAGIIKEKIPVIVAPQQDSVCTLLEQKARYKRSSFYYVPRLARSSLLSLQETGMNIHVAIDARWIESVNKAFLEASRSNVSDNALSYTFSTKLISEIQIENITNALLALILLKVDVSYNNLLSALATVHIPGRMQRMGAASYFDGAHTADSIRTTLETMTRLHPDGFTLLLACVRGKDSKNILRRIEQCPAIRSIVITNPAIRESDAENLIEAASSQGLDHRYIPDAHQALAFARGFQLPILCTGSFFLLSALSPQHPGD